MQISLGKTNSVAQWQVVETGAETSTRYGNQATVRVLRLLAEFTGSDDTRGVSELSRAAGMNKNMVYRALTTLVEAGYLARTPSGERYQLGYRLFELHVEEELIDLRAIARPTLERLHALTGESVFLSIIVGAARVNVDWIEGRGRRVSLGYRGGAVPLHCTRMSRVLLAHLTTAEVDDYLAGAEPLDQFDTIYPVVERTTAAVVRSDLATMRDAEHIAWRNPNQFDAAYITYPIAGADGRLLGIVTIGGPSERFDPDVVAADAAIRTAIAQLRQRAGIINAAPVRVGPAGNGR